MNRDKYNEVLKHCKDYNSKYDGTPLDIDKLADHLIANGIGDITAEKHRADVAEEALKALIAEMYENGIRTICNQDFLYQTRLEQAEARLKELEGER